MQPDRNDPEIRDFINRSAALSFSELAAEIAGRFGADRAWPVELVAEVHHELHPSGRLGRSRFLDDIEVVSFEVVSFIADRVGLVSLDKIVVDGAVRFGRARFPSRSHLYRLSGRIRARASKAPRARGTA